jgi:hypothetical protein
MVGVAHRSHLGSATTALRIIKILGSEHRGLSSPRHLIISIIQTCSQSAYTYHDGEGIVFY